MKNRYFLFCLMIAFVYASCVPKRELIASQMQTRALQNDSALMASKLADMQASVNRLQASLDSLNQQNAQLNNQNTNTQGPAKTFAGFTKPA